MELLLFLLGAGVVVGGIAWLTRRETRSERAAREAQLEPVRKLAYEDVTALGEDLQELDVELAGRELDEGARADYQRALDAYEAAKVAGERIEQPEEVSNVTQILGDGRYAMACVRARLAGEPLPTRRPPCFFDPRHGPSVTDVAYTPPGGVRRDVPACALDAERVQAGADPDARMVMEGTRRVPYYQGGRAYAPYASGYFAGFGAMDAVFLGLMFGSLGGFQALGEVGEGLADGLGDLLDGLDL